MGTAEELDEYRRIIDSKSRQDGDIPDSSTLENTTGDVMSPPPLPDDPVRGAMGILSPTSPTTDTEHTTGGDHTLNGGGGDGTDGNATFSEGEGDTSKATDTDLSHMSPKKEKKKNLGWKPPFFQKKKKKKKKK